ncbi:SDR family oxidoreductase [Aeromicrobium panaciterrae]|uniref:SDR family oxidoreductase n=1 Tax=Aeromicrobium panaciterrae TaxID=363861 RepID=UPI0031D6B6B8
MDLKNCVALVTGANRGLGKALCEALADAGARTVYAGTRDLTNIRDPRLVPTLIDVTDQRQLTAARDACPDVNLVVNNAGIFGAGSLLEEDAEESLRRQIEVNVFGSLRVAQTFAPVIERNGDGMIVNILSTVSWYTPPGSPAYAASKHAALAVSDGLRSALAPLGVRVMGVHAGLIDTEMVAAMDFPKVSARSVADAVLRGIEAGQDLVLADDKAREVWDAMRVDPEGFKAALVPTIPA